MEADTRELLNRFRNGADGAFEEICRLYRPLMQSAERAYLQRNPVQDAAEVRQEIVLALYSAARSYDVSSRGVTFGLYARVCIRNRLRRLARDTACDDGRASDSAVAFDEIPSSEPDPEQRAMDAESYRDVAERIRNGLTALEFRVLALSLDGFSRKEIADALHLSQKQVDNARYRIRKKGKKLI